MPTNLLYATNLHCSPAGNELLNGLDVSLGYGELIEVRGPNGSGKSTLLRILAGLQRADEGTVTRYTQNVSYLGDRPGLTGELTLYENLRWYGAIYGNRPKRERVQSSLEHFGLAAYLNTFVRELSSGQVRRGALAALALCEHELWILDEPLVSLDENGEETVNSMLRQHMKDGGSVILATHSALSFPATTSIELASQ